MNKIVNKFSLAGGKFLPELHKPVIKKNEKKSMYSKKGEIEKCTFHKNSILNACLEKFCNNIFVGFGF